MYMDGQILHNRTLNKPVVYIGSDWTDEPFGKFVVLTLDEQGVLTRTPSFDPLTHYFVVDKELIPEQYQKFCGQWNVFNIPIMDAMLDKAIEHYKEVAEVIKNLLSTGAIGFNYKDEE